MHKIYLVLLLILAVFLVTELAHTQEKSWPHLRGPKFNGHANEESLKISPKQQFPILWTVKTGQGYSSCVFADGRVFTQAQDRRGQYVICLDALTGKKLWRTCYGWPWELDGAYPGPYSTPTYHQDKIYFTGCYGTVGCLDSWTGKKIWTLNLEKDLGISMPSFGYACTPFIEDNRMYLSLGEEGGSVLALTADTGKLIWKTGNTPASYSSPLIINVEGKKQLICFLQNYLKAFDPANGRELWQEQISEGYDEHATWPTYDAPLLFCASPFFRDARTLKLSYQGSRAVKEKIWQNKSMSNDFFSSVIVNKHIYGFHIKEAQANPDGKTKGCFKCIDLKTGKELWQSEKTGHANVLAVGNKLFLFSDEGMMIIVNADPKNYHEITRQRLFQGVKCWSSPALVEGRLYFRGGKDFICLDLNRSASEQEQDKISTEETVKDKIDSWLHQFQGEVFIHPRWKHFQWWYLFSLIILSLAGVIAFALKKKIKYSYPLFIILTIFGSISIPIIVSPLVKEFIFTWPLFIFAMLMSILDIRFYSLENKKKFDLINRSLLILFILICYGYYLFCQAFFIISGIGFLVGLIPVAPLGYFLSRRPEGKLQFPQLWFWAIVFSVYFWFSAIFIMWKTG